MSDPLIRTRLLIGDGPLERLARAKVAVFGVGGVGGYCAEALARAGIGALDLYDDDTVSESNLNRQITALRSTLTAGCGPSGCSTSPRTPARWICPNTTTWPTVSTRWPPSWSS